MVKTCQFTTKNKSIRDLALEQQKSKSSLNYNHKTRALGFTLKSRDLTDLNVIAHVFCN